jgi:hypothetical protein
MFNEKTQVLIVNCPGFNFEILLFFSLKSATAKKIIDKSRIIQVETMLLVYFILKSSQALGLI